MDNAQHTPSMKSTRAINRRQFLRILGVSGAAGLALKVGVDLVSGPQTVSETRLLMGTVVNLTLVTDDAAAGQAIITACLDHMAELEQVLSRHNPSSQLSRLNRDASLTNPSPHLVHLLREATTLSEQTGGAFDVTIKPLVDVYQTYQANYRSLPPADAVEAALARVGYDRITVTDSHITFAEQGMGVTLDGIAKGYIVDQGTSILGEHGFDNILVEAGGDLSACGTRPTGQSWHIGIQSPRPDQQGLLNTFHVSDQAVATSGDYHQPFSDDLSEHHILNPITGHSSPELASATVFATSGVHSDALATALMVLGPERGTALIEALPNCEAYMVGKDMHIWQTSGLA
jgi:thiamine biosynthesis lipoprotein